MLLLIKICCLKVAMRGKSRKYFTNYHELSIYLGTQKVLRFQIKLKKHQGIYRNFQKLSKTLHPKTQKSARTLRIIQPKKNEDFD